jgi:hypothetical protein
MSFKEGKFTFDIDRLQARYEGALDKDKKVIRGTLTQGGNPLPLDLEPYVAEQKSARAAKPSDVDGVWSGTLDAMGRTLKLVITIANDADNKLSATMDVPEQGAKEIPAQAVTRDGSKLTMEFRGIAASYSGTLSADLAAIEGKWTQGQFDAPLTLKREKK